MIAVNDCDIEQLDNIFAGDNALDSNSEAQKALAEMIGNITEEGGRKIAREAKPRTVIAMLRGFASSWKGIFTDTALICAKHENADVRKTFLESHFDLPKKDRLHLRADSDPAVRTAYAQNRDDITVSDIKVLLNPKNLELEGTEYKEEKKALENIALALLQGRTQLGPKELSELSKLDSEKVNIALAEYHDEDGKVKLDKKAVDHIAHSSSPEARLAFASALHDTSLKDIEALLDPETLEVSEEQDRNEIIAEIGLKLAQNDGIEFSSEGMELLIALENDDINLTLAEYPQPLDKEIVSLLIESPNRDVRMALLKREQDNMFIEFSMEDATKLLKGEAGEEIEQRGDTPHKTLAKAIIEHPTIVLPNDDLIDLIKEDDAELSTLMIKSYSSLPPSVKKQLASSKHLAVRKALAESKHDIDKEAFNILLDTKGIEGAESNTSNVEIAKSLLKRPTESKDMPYFIIKGLCDLGNREVDIALIRSHHRIGNKEYQAYKELSDRGDGIIKIEMQDNPRTWWTAYRAYYPVQTQE